MTSYYNPIPPFKPECEVHYEGGPSLDKLYNDCDKNPGHPQFIPIDQFTIEHIPAVCRTQDLMDCIQIWCGLTVKISVHYTSLDRPSAYPGSKKPYPDSQFKGNKRSVRCGTGFLSSYQIFEGVPCPCKLCRNSVPEMRYLLATAETSTHVVFDDSEAIESVIECFYDSVDKKGIKSLDGVSAKPWVNQDDSCDVFCVTHDQKLMDILCSLLETFTRPDMKNYGLIISHPHGMSKHITIGEFLYITFTLHERFPTNKPIVFGSNDKCRLPHQRYCNINDCSTLQNEDLQTNENISLGGRDGECGKDISDGVSTLKTLRCDSQINTLCCTRTDSTLEIQGLSNCKVNSPQSLKTSCGKINVNMMPGSEYFLPPGSTFTLPPEAEYLCRCRDLNYGSSWVTFPPRTRYTMPNKTEICLPTGVEFHVQEIDQFVLSFQPCYRSYAIDTCNDSSGAKVILDRPKHPWSYARHAGVMEDGTNRTGTRFF